MSRALGRYPERTLANCRIAQARDLWVTRLAECTTMSLPVGCDHLQMLRAYRVDRREGTEIDTQEA